MPTLCNALNLVRRTEHVPLFSSFSYLKGNKVHQGGAEKIMCNAAHDPPYGSAA